VSAPAGVAAKRKPPAIAAGTAPSANQATRPVSTSSRLKATRLPLPTNWATVRMTIASRGPATATSTGSRMIAPPNPATDARAEANTAAAATAPNTRIPATDA